MTIDRETLIAFLDGELNAVTARRVADAIAADPVLAREAEEHRRIRRLVDARYARIVEQPVPERLLDLVHEHAKVIPMKAGRRPKGQAPQWAALAATLVLGLVVGQFVRPSGDLVGRDGILVARSRLAKALDTQLASRQGTNPAVRIGISFRARDGLWCRTFEQRGLAGIACRGDQGWTIRRLTEQVDQSSQYRQAASTDIGEAAQAMAAAGPLDAAAEARLAQSGWRSQ